MKSEKIIYPALLFVSIFFVTIACNNNDIEPDAYGNFEADEVIISAQVQGELLSLNIDEGDSVKEGQFVGLIDTTSISLQKNQLIAQKKLLLAKRENIGSQIEVQQEQLKNLEREQNRIDKLVAGNAATSQQLEDIEGKIDVSKSQIKSVKTQYESLKAENEVLQAQIDQLLNQLEKCKITNPVRGTVLDKYVMAGELVNPGKSLFKVADISELELKVYVSGNQLSQVNIGDEVKVYIDNEDNLKELKGKVSWISSEVEFTPKIIQTREERVNMVYAVKIRVNNDGTVKIGMPGEVKFIKNL